MGGWDVPSLLQEQGSYLSFLLILFSCLFSLCLSIFLSVPQITRPSFGAAVMLNGPFAGDIEVPPGCGLKVALTFFALKQIFFL